MRHKRIVGVLVGLILALILSAVIGMGVGAVMKSPGEVTTGFFTGDPLIWKYRAPRILVGTVSYTHLTLPTIYSV